MKQLLLLFVYLFPVFSFAQQTSGKTDSLPGKRLFKIDFIAPVTGNFTIGYEQAVSKTVSLDFQLGIIGAGAKQDAYPQAFGLFLKAGPCLYINPNYEAIKSKMFSRFQGTYIKPALALSSFSYEGYDYYSSYGLYESGLSRINNTFGALLLNIGHQFVFNRTLAFNFYGGIGYYVYFGGSDDYDTEYAYGFYGLSSDFPLAINAGLEIGIVSKR